MQPRVERSPSARPRVSPAPHPPGSRCWRLCRPCRCGCMAVWTRTRRRGFIDPAWEDDSAHRSAAYVKALSERLRAAGLQADGRSARGQVAATIESVADELDSDLIVMSTHALTGTGPSRARQRRRRGCAQQPPSGADGASPRGRARGGHPGRSGRRGLSKTTPTGGTNHPQSARRRVLAGARIGVPTSRSGATSGKRPANPLYMAMYELPYHASPRLRVIARLVEPGRPRTEATGGLTLMTRHLTLNRPGSSSRSFRQARRWSLAKPKVARGRMSGDSVRRSKLVVSLGVPARRGTTAPSRACASMSAPSRARARLSCWTPRARASIPLD